MISKNFYYDYNGKFNNIQIAFPFFFNILAMNAAGKTKTQGSHYCSTSHKARLRVETATREMLETKIFKKV